MDEPRTVRRRSPRTTATGTCTAGPPMPAFSPNWIAYRASLRTVDRREEVDPADVAVVCGSCGCEVDVSPAPHSPKCGAAS